MKDFIPEKNISWFYLAITSIFCGAAAYFSPRGHNPYLMLVAGVLIGALGFVISWLVSSLGIALMKKFKPGNIAVLIGSALLLYFTKTEFLFIPTEIFSIFLPASIIGGLLILYASKKSKPLLISTYILIIAGACTSLYFLLKPGIDDQKEIPVSEFYNSAAAKAGGFDYTSLLTGGALNVQEYTYGPGNDLHRNEYGKDVSWKSASVDASLILPQWDSVSQEDRQEFLGFGVDKLPLNARIYLPEGNGPFPVLIIVHGNHSMAEWSDAGYAYLGRHLASRGTVVVSVDENFLNSHWSGDFRGREMPARAWILLKHIELLKKWNEDPQHTLSGKLDINNIILAGHSRGGEAVQIAAVYNKLNRFPENGNLLFDCNYSIKGVISLAPTDYRYARQVSMENVNYLTLQGSYDSDESSFWGLRAYRRLKFTDTVNYFKSAVYIHRANHSQFNTDWGDADSGAPFKWFLNKGSLIPGEDQQKIALFYITAFTEGITGTRKVSKSIFQNIAPYRDLLPSTYILTHYEDSKFKKIIEYGEDAEIDIGYQGMRIFGDSLRVWKEEDLKSRDKESLQDYAAVIGWVQDSTATNFYPSYILQFDSAVSKDPISGFSFVMGAGEINELKTNSNDTARYKDPKYKFTLAFTDTASNEVKINLHEVRQMAPRLNTQFGRVQSINERLGSKWEPQTESFIVSKDLLLTKNKDFDINHLRAIKFCFDENPYGVVIIDGIYSIQE